MIIGILKEPSFESRVSLIAAETALLAKQGITIWVEPDAGSKAFCLDGDYIKAGALIKSREEVLNAADLILAIHYNNLPDSLQGKVMIGIYQPAYNQEHVQEWAKNSNTVFSLDMLPRITRAQSMDVLSSQSNIAGYKAALLAATTYPRYFPMMMTAAGNVPPAKLLVLGAGVAGLQAVATSRRLGAVVEVFDTRAAAKEEVLSLGAKFIEVDGAADDSKAGGYAVDQTSDFQQRQKAKIAESIKKADVVITTAQIFGKKAPVLVTKEMIENMKPGSVIIDMASATGGNTELTLDGQTIVWNHVTIVGNSSLAATMPADASRAYGRNLLSFLKMLIDKEGKLKFDLNDEVLKSACITNEGEIISPIIKNLIHGNTAQLHSQQS